MKEKVTYKEYNGYKVGDSIFYLDYYTARENTILEIYDDYYSDEDNFTCKWVRYYGGCSRLSDIYDTEREAEYGIQNKKDAYDRYVTRGY